MTKKKAAERITGSIVSACLTASLFAAANVMPVRTGVITGNGIEKALYQEEPIKLQMFDPVLTSSDELYERAHLGDEEKEREGIAGIYEVPDSFIDPVTMEETEYTGIKTYESTDKITYGVAGEVNRAAEPDGEGFMKLEGRYLAAIGTGFGIEVGQYFNIILKDKTVIPCIMGDTKADCDTDEGNMFTVHSKCATEFIVKIPEMRSEDRQFGDVSKIRPEWEEKPVMIIALNKKWGTGDFSEEASYEESYRTYCSWKCVPARIIAGT